MKDEDIKGDLLRVAADYNHSILQQVLENYKEPLLLLRAKNASYETIVKLVAQRGIKVSVSTVRKFCITNDAETRRLRAGCEYQSIASREESSPLIPVSRTITENRAPLISDPGKRGPRIARDQL